MADEQKRKRILQMKIGEISLVRRPANEEEYLILKSMDADSDAADEAIQKAAEVHKALMAERLEALKKLSDEIIANAMNLDPDELNSKLYQLSDISWSIRDVANTVNISKSGDANMTETEKKNALTKIESLTADLEKTVKLYNEAVKKSAEGAATAATAAGAGDQAAKDGDIEAAVNKAKEMVNQLQKTLETVNGDAAAAAAAAASEGNEDDLNKGVKQLSKDRQDELKKAIVHIGKLLKEIDPEFDANLLITPPTEEPDAVTKALEGFKEKMMGEVTKALKETIDPVQKQVEGLVNATGESRVAGGDGDGNAEEEVKKGDNLWGGKIVGRA